MIIIIVFIIFKYNNCILLQTLIFNVVLEYDTKVVVLFIIYFV